MGWLTKVRAVLGLLTDWLLKGRQQGWWSKKDVPQPKE